MTNNDIVSSTETIPNVSAEGQKSANVPNLRFLGFDDAWDYVRVSDLIETYSTNSLSWDMLDYENGTILNLHYGLIHSGLPTQIDCRIDKLPFIKSEYMPKHYTLCEEGDVAFADASEDTEEVGKVVEFSKCSENNIVCGLHTIHARDKIQRTIVGYKGYAFSSVPFHHQIRRIAQGTKIYSINTRNFEEVYIGVPGKAEQRKIADFLSLIDDRIKTQNKIIEDLIALKQWIIHRYYATNISNLKQRFSSYISQVSTRNSAESINNVLSVSNKNGFVKQSEQFEDREIASDDKHNYKVVEKNDFAYNPARINVGSIARLKTYENGIVSPMYVCFRPNDKVLPEYLDYYFQSVYFFAEMSKRLEGSVRQCLSYEALSEIKVFIPSLDEQKEIIKKLNSVENKIELEKQILLNYQHQKKYLLSQMFI